MVETIHIGDRPWGYGLLALCLSLSIVALVLFFSWLYKYFIPGRRLVSKSVRVMLYFQVFTPLVVAVGLILCAYFISYCHFYSVLIHPGKELVAEYLWPKGSVIIPSTGIESISVVKKGFGREEDKVIVIMTKSGRKLESIAPNQDAKALAGMISDKLQMMNQQ